MFILVVLIILGSLIYKIIRAINEGDTTSTSSYHPSLFDNNHSHPSIHNSMFDDDYLNDPCDLRNPNNIINGTMSPDYFDHNDTFSSSNSFGSSSSFNDPFNDPFSSSSSFGSSSSFNDPFNNGL